MADDHETELLFGWAATLLLYTSDIGRHLKEFDSIFPGLGRKGPIQVEQLSFLRGGCVERCAANAAQQPIQADAVMIGNGNESFQAC